MTHTHSHTPTACSTGSSFCCAKAVTNTHPKELCCRLLQAQLRKAHAPKYQPHIHTNTQTHTQYSLQLHLCCYFLFFTTFISHIYILGGFYSISVCLRISFSIGKIVLHPSEQKVRSGLTYTHVNTLTHTHIVCSHEKLDLDKERVNSDTDWPVSGGHTHTPQ